MCICACVLFVEYRFFSDRFPYCSGSMYFTIVLLLLIFIKSIPVLIRSGPGICINPQGFFVSSFMIGIGRGWIGWDEVEIIGKQGQFVSVVLKNPKETKAKLSWFYDQIPTFRTPILRIGPSFLLGLTARELFDLFDDQFVLFKGQTGKLSDPGTIGQETKTIYSSDSPHSGESSFRVYGIHHGSKGFLTSIVIGPKNFKYTFSDSLYRYDDIQRIRKTYHSPDPHFVGQLLDRLLGNLAPRLTIRMKDGTIIYVEHYITREDMLEVSDGFQPTQAFKEIEDFLSSKIDKIENNK